MSSPLLPPERMALLLATEQIKRRENPSPNITAVLIMALARLVDKLGDEETQLQALAAVWSDVRGSVYDEVRFEASPLFEQLDALIEEDNDG